MEQQAFSEGIAAKYKDTSGLVDQSNNLVVRSINTVTK
jgi:hypothetical protein